MRFAICIARNQPTERVGRTVLGICPRASRIGYNGCLRGDKEMRESLRSTKKLGVTPLLLRLAWDYLKKGPGTHYISHREYDNVVVSEMYPWTVVDDEGQGAIKVTFKRGQETLRYVEFGVKAIGAGGVPQIYEAKV